MSQKKKGDKKKAPPKKDPKIKVFEEMIKGIKGLKDSEFSMCGVKFQVKKLSPIAGFHMFEKIRYEISSNAESSEAEPDSPLLFYKAVLTLEPRVIEEIRVELFKSVSFRGNGVESGWMELDGSEEMALQGMEALHIYELLIRCLSVNFSGSFHALIQKFPGMKRLLNLLKQ